MITYEKIICPPAPCLCAVRLHTNRSHHNCDRRLKPAVVLASQTRFINGDPTLWKQNASHRDDATILGAFGGYGERGWDAVGARYDWASSQYKGGGATLKVEYLNIVVSGDLGYTVGIERQERARVGDQQDPMQRALRATQIFRKEDGAWRLLHRHADPLIEKKAP